MIALIFSVLLSTNAHAERCMKNINAETVCSKYSGGTAQHDYSMKIVCGKGECARDINGQFQCSLRPGGVAKRNNRVRVVCSGGCEPASEENCEILQ